jgi:rubrerythrin
MTDEETHTCANCGSKWKMIETNDIGDPNVCPVCMADDWNKPHHYED